MDDLLRLRQVAVVGESGAIVLPNQLFPTLEAIEADLNAHGLRIADPPFVEIDPRTGELVLTDLPLEVARVGGAAPVHGSSDRTRTDPLARYVIREWSILRRSDRHQMTVHEGLAATLPLVESTGIPAPGSSPSIEGLGRLLSTIRVRPIWYQGKAGLLTRLIGDR